MVSDLASHYLLDQLALSNAIRRLIAEYVFWVTKLISAILFGTGDQAAIIDRLYENADASSRLLGSFYGQDAQAKIYALLYENVEYLAAMVRSYRAQDAAKVTDQRQAMYDIADEYSQLLAQLNPHYDRMMLQITMYELINDMETVIVRLLSREYKRSIAAHDQLLSRAYRLADELTYGLQRQFGV